MGFIESLRSWKDILLEGDEEETETGIPAPIQEEPMPAPMYSTTVPRQRGNEVVRSKVVDMQIQTSVKVSWHRPRSYNENGEARGIADDLNNNRSVILNLEDIDRREARRLLDFLSGVAFARSSVVRKIAMNVYLFGPHNLDFIGDEITTMLEESSLFS